MIFQSRIMSAMPNAFAFLFQELKTWSIGTYKRIGQYIMQEHKVFQERKAMGKISRHMAC